MIPCSARCPNKIVNGRCINEITVAPASYTDEEWAECMEDMGYEPDKIPSRKDMVVAGYFDIFMETVSPSPTRHTHLHLGCGRSRSTRGQRKLDHRANQRGR